jgi:spermidine synthase
MHQVWRKPLKKISNQRSWPSSAYFQFPISNILILGLAGGTVVKLVKKLWPEAKITGVDIDPIMVKLGKKYLGLDKKDVKIVIDDAYDFIKRSQVQNPKSKYDLILVDLYVGDQYPNKFEDLNFIKLVKSSLAKNGIAIFNRLYYGGKRTKAVRFEDKLEKLFKKVDIIFPEANVMFIATKH